MSASNRRVAELITDVEEGKLEVRPHFQRRLVWTNADKESFLDTVLKGYPFPEIFIATGQLDRTTARRVNWLVDGCQRVTTLKNYVRGSKDLLYKTIPRFEDLEERAQTNFLDYEVAVRDLGTIPEATIKEIFRRINSTDYALKSMEILNAMFNGAYKQYCEALSRQPFFERHKIFTPAVKKRMYDLTFCVILVTTILSGYYRRDEKNAEYLERYNDDFPQQDEVQSWLDRIFDFIERCGFEEKARVWKQTDLFTVLVELYAILIVDKVPLDPKAAGAALKEFYKQVGTLYAAGPLPDEKRPPAGQEDVFQYLKAATKATNDKYARVERARVISKLLRATAGKSSPTAKPKPKSPPRQAR